MQNTQRQLIEVLRPTGIVAPMPLDDLRALVERYPYYHLARISMMKVLYDQHDSSFTEELRRAALYLPSRETLYHVVEGENLKPDPQSTVIGLMGGATVAHKPNLRIDSHAPEFTEQRTTALIDDFLSGMQVAETNEPSVDATAKRRVPRADATTDYISYMLQEEEDAKQEAEQENVIESATEQVIDTFLQKKGERRIRLKDKKDSELQKPVIDTENGSQKLAFTETLAHIYIKQHKFEQAIEIIRRLSLKNPEKNRYFADQIRFLEKLLVNQKAAETKNV